MFKGLSEIIAEVVAKDDRQEKIDTLRKNIRPNMKPEPLQQLLRYAYDPRIKWLLPAGGVPEFTPITNFDHEGTFAAETRNFYYFVEGGEKVSPFAFNPATDEEAAQVEYDVWMNELRQNRQTPFYGKRDGEVRAELRPEYFPAVQKAVHEGQIDPNFLPYVVNTEEAKEFWRNRVRAKKKMRMEKIFMEIVARLQPNDAKLLVQVKDRHIEGIEPDLVLEAFPGLWTPTVEAIEG